MRSIKMILHLLSLFCLFFEFCTVVAAELPLEYKGNPEKPGKYALVIGVENYKYLGDVTNAISDATEVANTIGKGDSPFNTIFFLRNPKTGRQIRLAIDDLIKQSQLTSKPSIVMIYFAGHGFQVGQLNYIAPADAAPDTIIRDSVPVSELVFALRSAKVSVGIAFIDACRNRAEAANATAPTSISEKVTQLGFSKMDGGADSIVILSASAGQFARSTSKKFPSHSPFTGPLIKKLAESKSLGKIYAEIVYSIAQEFPAIDQDPIQGTSMILENIFIFPNVEEQSSEKTAWSRVVSSKYKWSCLQDFRKRFPLGAFSSSAIYALEFADTSPDGLENCSTFP